MVRQSPATTWRVVLAFCVTVVLALTPMTLMLAAEGAVPSAGAVAEARYGESALLAVLGVASVATVAVATVVLVSTRSLRPTRG